MTAIVIPTTIDALPSPPLPTDPPATFDVKAFASWAAQAVMVTQTNAATAATYQNALASAEAASLVELAYAASNYKGPWSALTGALNRPASVTHAGSYWALAADLADVTAATPGVSANWSALNVGAGGALVTSSAVDLTLTATSVRVQAVAMTVSDKSLILPAASTLQTGGAVYVVRNEGLIAFRVKDGAGGFLANVDPGQIVMLYLQDAGSTAGEWAVGASESQALTQSIYQATATVINAVASVDITVTRMSDTQAIACWKNNSTGYINACTLNIAGNVISAGAVLAVNAVTSSLAQVVALSTTQAVVAYIGTSSYLNAVTLDVSGTTLTAGTIKVINAVASSELSLTELSATELILAFTGTSSYTYAFHLTVSGTVITNGALATIESAVGSTKTVARLSATQAILAWYGASTTAYVCTLNVSGTTITAGTAVGISGTYAPQKVAVVALSATQAVAAWRPSSTTVLVTARIVDISGTDVIPGPEFAAGSTLRGASIGKLRKVTANKMVYATTVNAIGATGGFNDQLAAMVLGIVDSQMKAGPPAQIKQAYGTYGDVDVMSEKQAIVVYGGPSSYLNARVLEIPQ